MAHRYRLEKNLPEGLSLHWGQSEETLYQANLLLFLDLDWKTIGIVSCVLDSGEISENTVEDGFLENDRSSDAFFREGYFESSFLDSKGVALKLGQQHLVSGEGYILDDFLLAGQVGLDLHRLLGLPWEFYGTVSRVRGSSLYFQLRAVHPFTVTERVSLSVGWLHDTEGFFADMLQGIAEQLPDSPYAGISFRSEGDLFWLVVSGRRVVGGFFLSAVGIVEGGSIRVSGTEPSRRTFRRRIPCVGYLVDFTAGRALTDRVSIEVFYLMASGEGDPLGVVRKGKTLNAYLSIVPFVTRTNLFFNGGINENFSTRSFRTAGNSARGFGVPGLKLTWSPVEDVTVETTLAYLFSTASPPREDSDRTYGWETDLTGMWDWGRHLRLSVEADLFLPGGFFDRRDRPDPDPAYRLMGGVDVCF